MSNSSTVKQRIYQAVLDIHNAGRTAERGAIKDMTGLKMSVVDDHLKTLKDAGKIRGVKFGKVEPAEVFPANRPVSKTVLAEGEVLIEVGEEELRLTPGEARVVGLALHGDAMEIAHIRGEREVYDTVQGLKAQLREQGKRLTDAMNLMAKMAQGNKEPDLFTETQ